MWHWRSLKALALGLALSTWALPALGAPSSIGSVSEEEASILWKDSKTEYEQGRYGEAIPKLRRYLDRYPGYPGYLEARMMLGHALLEKGDPKGALPLLRDFATTTLPASRSIRGSLLLARAYLKLNRYAEANLLLTGLVRGAARKIPLAHAEALLLRSQALVSLKLDRKAGADLDSAWKLLVSTPAPLPVAALRAEAVHYRLEHKRRSCDRLFPNRAPGEPEWDEGQIRDRLHRRSACLQEALLVLQDIFEGPLDESSNPWHRKIGASMSEALRLQSKLCSEPPLPRQGRNSKEFAKLREEMAQVLAQDCKQDSEMTASVLQALKQKAQGPYARIIEEVAQGLKPAEGHP